MHIIFAALYFASELPPEAYITLSRYLYILILRGRQAARLPRKRKIIRRLDG